MPPRWTNCPRCQVLIPIDGSQPKQCPSCGTALEGEATWFYAQNRQKSGPVPWQELRQLASAGRLAPTAMLLRAGSQKWIEARTVEGLFAGGDTPPLAAAQAPTSDVTVGFEKAGTLSAPPAEVAGYEILGELGRGGMGVVYKAKQLGLNRLVALKMILAGAHAGAHELARFRAEAGAVARLQHPNIVQIHDIGAQDGRPYFSLEYVEGGSLDRKLAGTPQPPRDAARLVETLARAVHHAHQHGIVHRDLKPANVLLQFEASGSTLQSAIPKITDFGLAKLEDSGTDTKSGAILGTPGYVAPEQASGKTREVGPAADVYALGAILYEMLTGGPPFRGETPMDTLMLVLQQEPVPPTRLQPKVPKDLETICLKCLSKSVERRYPSAAELADDLGRFQRGEPIHARPASPAERVWRWARRYPLAAALIVGVSLLLVVVTLGSAFGLWHLSRLSEELVRSTALESAAQETEVLEELNNFYSAEVVDRVKPFGVKATHDYTSREGTIPTPATLTIDLGEHIRTKSPRGMQVRLYSDYPFKGRREGGPRDAFEWEALGRLRAAPTEPVYKFERADGRTILRYATARTMKESCVKCHNEHPDSTKRDWKVGEVRGVVEVVRPLDHDEVRTSQGLRGTYRLIAIISAALLVGLSVVVAGIGGWLWYLGRSRGVSGAA